MTSLSDRLKSLGVQVGATNLPQHQSPIPPSLPGLESLGGQEQATPFGPVYLIERQIPIGQMHGGQPIAPPPVLPAILSAWANAPELTQIPPQSLAFLDIETSGLMGGAGTYVVLIGIGRFEKDKFHLAQFFLRHPNEENALLAAAEEFLAPCQGLVTYNGKTFDLPLLRTRYRLNGWQQPPVDAPIHLDILHLARRLWKTRLPNCTLMSMETHILGLPRSADDVPGWQIPELYYDYLHHGAVKPLKRVVYHHGMDVISLSALINQIIGLLTAGQTSDLPGLDWFSRGKLHQDYGQLVQARECYQNALECDLPEEIRRKTMQRLSIICKRLNDWEQAVALWRKAAVHGQIFAFEELAKMYEHRDHNLAAARQWTQAALQLLASGPYSELDRAEWQTGLEYRLARLQRRLQD